MKSARILFKNEILNVTINDDEQVVSEQGETFEIGSFEWLPPCEGKVFVLAINYADHAAELSFKAPDEPLVFLKNKNSLIGHDQKTYRPDNINYMHYECELVVVIGKEAKNVSQKDAMDYVGGYTVGNDYAIRDYLENYYRPNLRVKSRDTCTPIGPYIVDAQDIQNPHNLVLRTYINGELKQEGNTKDLVFNIPHLISYLSEIMTLTPGDMIFTGTPEGLADVKPGDVVITEVEGVGVLKNTIISESEYLQNL